MPRASEPALAPVEPKPAPHRRDRPAGRPDARRRKLSNGRLIALLFLGPAMIVLVALVAYPIVNTVWLSLFNADGTRFVGLGNYIEMFTAPDTRRAIINNAVWVIVAPALVTAIGLVCAVLTERVKMGTAFKAILFMPMAISFLAAGVTFRLVYDENPDRGVLNAVIVSVHDAFAPPSVYYGASPRDGADLSTEDGAIVTSGPVSPGTPVLIPLVGLPADRIPAEAAPAASASSSGLSGTVWLDFTRGGGGTAGAIDSTEAGLPGVLVHAVKNGEVVASTSTDASGRFTFPQLSDGGYQIRLDAGNFTEPFAGATWLGPTLVTPSIIVAYVWIWAGFAMVLIAAGLAAIPREALEAARVDGATEWQVFSRVTVPLLRPVLVVVLVTMIINVLKIFDLVLVLAPDSSQDEANVVALEMYRVSFGGDLNFGLGSALGVLLFLLVLPAMLFNIRKLRREQA
jgi:alpha-glucoside transport system permease protein